MTNGNEPEKAVRVPIAMLPVIAALLAGSGATATISEVIGGVSREELEIALSKQEANIKTFMDLKIKTAMASRKADPYLMRHVEILESRVDTCQEKLGVLAARGK